jgi:hypothetical protein
MNEPETSTSYAESVAVEIIEQATYSISKGHKVSLYVRGVPEPLLVDEVASEAYTVILSYRDGPVYHFALTEVFGVRVADAED